MQKRVMLIYGTRPEAVKMAPLVKALHEHDLLEPYVVSTGQHQQMMEQVNDWFGVTPDADLKAFKQGAELNELGQRILAKLDPLLAEAKPDAVVVQGDTITVSMSAIAAFYRLVPVVHLEAGLRTGDIHSPFPEEANRKLAAQVTALHLAPTDASRQNLLREGIDPDLVPVVGNTVIDALQWTADQPVTFTDERLNAAHAAGQKMLLLTTHRRENWGEPMRRIGQAVGTLARRYPDWLFLFPAHANPKVREAVEPGVHGLDNVIVCDALDYPQFVHAQKWASIVLTDSGGVQEEAPAFGKPVLVLRDNTERPEAVTAGTVKLIGTDSTRIVDEVTTLIDTPAEYQRMAQAVNPYGDGRAAERSTAAIAALLGVGKRIPDFTPTMATPDRLEPLP